MKKVLCLLVTLMCLLSLVGCGNASGLEEAKDVEVPEFSITVCDKTITDKEMGSYPVYKISVSLTNSEGTNKDYTYYGYSLTDVLKAAGVSMKEGKVVAIATDGYEIDYEDNIILDTTLIALIRDDKAFKEGPWLAPCSSQTNGDYLKNLSSITIAE